MDMHGSPSVITPHADCSRKIPTKFPQNSQKFPQFPTKDCKARLPFLKQPILYQTAGGIGDERANCRKL